MFGAVLECAALAPEIGVTGDGVWGDSLGLDRGQGGAEFGVDDRKRAVGEAFKSYDVLRVVPEEAVLCKGHQGCGGVLPEGHHGFVVAFKELCGAIFEGEEAVFVVVGP